MRSTATPSSSTRIALWLLGAAILVVLASALDSWAYAQLSYRTVYEQNWGRAVRVAGWLPFWMLAGAALWLSVPTRWGRMAGMLLGGSPLLAGAVGQVLKLVIRRGRPLANDGLYVFRDYAERMFYSRDFGMPSGDAIVAFAACAVLARLWPRGRPIWYGLATMCVLARVMSGAHFLSDVTVAAILGWLVTALLWQRARKTPPIADDGGV